MRLAKQPPNQGTTNARTIDWEDHPFHGFTTEALPIVYHHSFALLLSFLMVFLFLGKFHRQLGCFNIIPRFVQMAMVTFPVILLVTGFNLQALFCHSLSSLPGARGFYTQGGVPPE